jgi:hypothetical protein
MIFDGTTMVRFEPLTTVKVISQLAQWISQRPATRV